MKIPLHFKISSVIVKTMIINGKTVHRHFFKWYDRVSLDMCYVRLTLIRQDGTTIGKMHDLKFPKVKQIGTVQVVQDGKTVETPHYDTTQDFYVDADEIAKGFDFYTSTLLKKSAPFLDAISPVHEDLALLQQLFEQQQK